MQINVDPSQLIYDEIKESNYKYFPVYYNYSESKYVYIYSLCVWIYNTRLLSMYIKQYIV